MKLSRLYAMLHATPALLTAPDILLVDHQQCLLVDSHKAPSPAPIYHIPQ